MGSGQVASVFALYSYDPSSNTAEVYSVLLSEAGDDSFKKNDRQSGRTVASYTSDPWFKSWDHQLLSHVLKLH